MTQDEEREFGYGMETTYERMATFVDGVIFTAANGQLHDADQYLKDVEPKSQLSNRILLARASADLDNDDGKLVVEIIEGSGEKFAVSGTFSLTGATGETIPGKFVAGLIVDLNSNLFTDAPTGPRVTQDGMKQLITAAAQTQALLETENNKYMTRTEYLQIRG